MKDRARTSQLLCAMVGALALLLVAPLAAAGVTLHTTQIATAGYGATPVGFARTPDGVLHVVVTQNTNWGNSYSGIAARSISPSGHIGPPVQALNWDGQSAQGDPGLAVTPSGALEATWGGYPFGSNGPWGISSTNGGATWSAPTNIGSGLMAFGDSHVPVAVSHGTPVLVAGCCGNIVIQQGLGPGAPTAQITNSADGCAGNTNAAVDAATGVAIAGWDSCDGSGGLWLQPVAPSLGAAQKAPVPSQYGSGVPLIVAGRDTGPGVFAAYPANYANTTKIRLLRYGGGSVAVGASKHLHADEWGVATGPAGRMWVMWWGQNTKTGQFVLAATRSNKAVTRFEPIQTFGPMNWSFLFTLAGDGRLGPLDLLIGGNPNGTQSASGFYYARILPVLTASVSAGDLGKGKFKLKVDVTDAGDAVSGATVSVAGSHRSTNGGGHAELTIAGRSGQRVTVAVSDGGYQPLHRTITL
jgi:hypothetical protein